MKKITSVVRRMMRRPKRIVASRHGIAPAQIDSFAAQSVERLQKAGFETYIVGGAVRDLLCNIPPKDFDIGTAATPPEVRRLFRRSLIIGRRFKIVHLPVYRNGRRSVMEVTTFRGDGEDVVHDERGRILHDNSFGTVAEDAVRRDFSCNALFYNPTDGKIIDYVGGYEDIKKRRLSVIGEPGKRFRQDPVRILRALRLQCKLGLSMDRRTNRAIRDNAELLRDISPSRLFDEIIKIINSGVTADIFHRYAECGVAAHVLPAADDEHARALLQDTDRRNADSREVSLSFALAGLFWPPVSALWHARCKDGVPPVKAMETAIAVAEFSQNQIVPKRITGRIVDLYFVYARLCARMTQRRAAGLLRHRFFKRAVAFGELCDNNAAGAEWWREYGRAESEARGRMLQQRA